MNSSYLSLWPENNICEKNDDYETYETIHQQKVRQQQQPILNHQGENKPYYSEINYLGTRQMVDNINNSSEQRQFNGGNNNNSVSRKKNNNGKRLKQNSNKVLKIFFI